MKSKAIQFLEANQSGERSTFVDDAKWRRDNASWLKRSRRVAYAIMDYMQENQFSRNDIAEKLGVSPQYVSKILSGKANKNRDKLPNMCFNGYIWQLIATFWHITYKMFPRGQTNTETSLQSPFINWSCSCLST